MRFAGREVGCVSHSLPCGRRHAWLISSSSRVTGLWLVLGPAASQLWRQHPVFSIEIFAGPCEKTPESSRPSI